MKLAAAAIAGATVIVGTFPAFQSGPLCGVSADSVRDVQTVRVVAQVQSETWAAMSPAMKALPEVWAAYWPRVRAEADTFAVGTVQGRGGRTFTVTVTDTRRPLWVWAVARNGRGVSCRGRVVEVK